MPKHGSDKAGTNEQPKADFSDKKSKPKSQWQLARFMACFLKIFFIVTAKKAAHYYDTYKSVR